MCVCLVGFTPRNGAVTCQRRNALSLIDKENKKKIFG